MLVPALGLMLLAAAQAGTPSTALPTVEERLKGLELHAGFVPFAWDARQGKLLLEVSRPGQDFLYGAGLSGGAGTLEVALDRGQLGELALVRFERVGPRMLVRQLQTDHRATSGSPEERRAVEESFPSSVLCALEVVAEEQGRVLLDASEWLLRDTRIALSLRQAEQGEWREEPARAAFVAERSGAFPLNTEIEALITLSSDKPPDGVAAVLPDGRSLSLRLHHTLRALPEPGFVPLDQDPRVGLLVRGHKDYTAPAREPLERRLATRWRLEKRDPQAARSEPRAPIVFYLDRGIPEPERTVIKDAALWWNHAFEQAGFERALELRDLPPGASFLDARYSGIEWIHRAERAWSIGETQTDPRTGEILHAVARIDSHRRRTTARQWRNMARPRGGACTAGDSPDPSLLAGLDVDGVVDEQTLALQRLAYLSAHEVGHTLGFDHNWAATTFGWGSVMDYLAAHVEPRDGGLDLSDAFPRDVGSYDRLMARWGYTPGLDAAARDALVREAYAQGQVFPLESDPRWAEYDWGPDPVAWLRTTQAVRRVILERFGVGQLDPGQPLYDLQARFNLAYLYHRFGLQAAQGYVGGQFQTNATSGDGQTARAWVPGARQQEALELLLAALEPVELDISDGVLAVLVAPPAGSRPTREAFAPEGGPAVSLLAAARTLAGLIVQPLLDPERTARLTSPDAPRELRLERLLQRLVGSSWRAAPAEGARLAALRRVAQRVVLDSLLDLAARQEATPEVRGLARAQLAQLHGELRLRHAAQMEAEAHLRLCERDLAEFLAEPAVRQPRKAAPAPPPGRPIG